MNTRWRWAIVGSGLGLCVLGLGFAQRSEDPLVTPGRDTQMGRDPSEAPWTAPIERLDDALATKDISAAVIAWRDAYSAALGSRQWEGMIAVGDAALRMGDVEGSRLTAESTAGQSYLSALFRARRQGSLDGALRTAEAFAALGDRVGVPQALSIAEELSARDPEWPARVRAFAEQLAPRVAKAKGSDVDPR